MPFKSEKQRRYMHANLPEIAKRWERDYANGGIASQGGMKNYLGEQPMVNAPQNWRSGPGSPSTELAYITQPEKELILRSNIHGSLQNGPNEGPSGIMSLDGQGDYTRDRSPGANQGSRQGNAQAQEHMRNILTGQQNIGQTSAVSERTRRGAVPEWVERPDGTMAHVGSAYKDTGKRGFLSKLFGGANKYGYGQTYGTGSGRFFDRKPSYSLVGSPGRQRYVSTDPRIGQVKPGYGGRILGGLASLFTGIPLIGGVIGNQIDKYKPKSYWDKLPDSEKRRLNALNITPYNEQKLTAPNVPMDSLSLQNFSKDPLTNKLSTPKYNLDSSNMRMMEVANNPALSRYKKTQEFAPTKFNDPWAGATVQQVGMNQDQLDRINKQHQTNLAVDEGTTNFFEWLPGKKYVEDFVGDIKGRDKTKFFSDTPKDIVYGDPTTGATTQEIQDYINSLSNVHGPIKNQSLSGYAKKNLIGIAQGGRVGYGAGGLASLWPR